MSEIAMPKQLHSSERNYIQAMNTAFFEMSMQLSQFYLDKQDLRSVQEVDIDQVHNTNKLIKKEVIDVADLVEAVSKVIVVMNQKIDRIENQNKNNKVDQQLDSVNKKLAAIVDRLNASGQMNDAKETWLVES